MAETFALSEAVELAVVERSGFVESRHAGSAIVLAPDGSTARSLGSTNSPVLPRSCMKPFQAMAVMGSQVALDGPSAAIATASHTGTPAHLSLVRALLTRAELTEDALRCPGDWPSDEAAKAELIRSGAGKRPMYMNCSGKHAAMLLACVQNGWPTESYLDPSHPLQIQIRDVVERLTGEHIAATAVDGCGAPVHALSLAGLARGIQRIVTAKAGSPFALYRNAATLTAAVLAHGWAIQGHGKPNTVVIERLGVFAKGGAEGVLVLAAPDGTTVALKMLDGTARAASIVGLTLLADAGAIAQGDLDAVCGELGLDVLGGGLPVGAVRVADISAH